MQVKGRAEILGIMARRKYNEIMQVRRAERAEGRSRVSQTSYLSDRMKCCQQPDPSRNPLF